MVGRRKREKLDMVDEMTERAGGASAWAAVSEYSSLTTSRGIPAVDPLQVQRSRHLPDNESCKILTPAGAKGRGRIKPNMPDFK